MTQEIRIRIQENLFQKGVLVAATMNAHKTFRIEPPLTITEAQINLMVNTLESVLRDLSRDKVTPIRKLKTKSKNTNKSINTNKKRANA
jgi:hypothetical protein